MGAESVVGGERGSHALRILRLDVRVDMLPVVTERKAIEGPRMQRGHIVRRQVVAELVALVDRHPKGASVRLPRQAHGVAQSGGINGMRAGRAVYLPHGVSLGLGV